MKVTSKVIPIAREYTLVLNEREFKLIREAVGTATYDKMGKKGFSRDEIHDIFHALREVEADWLCI